MGTQEKRERRERIMRPDYSSRLFLGSSYSLLPTPILQKESSTTAVFYVYLNDDLIG